MGSTGSVAWIGDNVMPIRGKDNAHACSAAKICPVACRGLRVMQ